MTRVADTAELEKPLTFTLLELRPMEGYRWLRLLDWHDEDFADELRVDHLVTSVRMGNLETFERRCKGPAFRYARINGRAVCATCLLELLRPLRGP